MICAKKLANYPKYENEVRSSEGPDPPLGGGKNGGMDDEFPSGFVIRCGSFKPLYVGPCSD